MILTNEFTVAGDLETVWTTLLDMKRVASCLPGATIEDAGEDNRYNGSMTIKIGPMTVTYRGTATLTEVDNEAHRAVISLSAKEAKGQGTAMATITNLVEPFDGGTRVKAETDLHITGPQARFGRGILEDMGSRVLAEFSRRLEQEINAPGSAAGGPATGADQAGTGDGGPAGSSAGSASSAGAKATDVLDVGSVVSAAAKARMARLAAPISVGVLALIAWFRRKKS